jgi:hypothetical protein
VGGFRKAQLLHRDGRAPVIMEGEYPTRAGPIVALGFGPNDGVVGALQGGEVRVWSVPAGREPRRFKCAEEASGAWLWARGAGLFVWTWTGKRHAIRLASFTGGGGRLVGSWDGRPAGDMDGAGRQIAWRFLAGSPLSGPAEDKVVRVWDLDSRTSHVLGRIPGAGEGLVGGVNGISFADNDRIVGSSETAGLLLFDLRDGRHRLLSSRPSTAVAVGRGGVIVAVLREPDEVVRIDLDRQAPSSVFACPGCSRICSSARSAAHRGSPSRPTAAGWRRAGNAPAYGSGPCRT